MKVRLLMLLLAQSSFVNVHCAEKNQQFTLETRERREGKARSVSPSLQNSLTD